MVSAEAAKRHRALMADLVTRWRRRAELVPPDPAVPYDDDDEAPDDRALVVVEVLGRFLGKLGKVDLSSCVTSADVDRLFAAHVRAEAMLDTRPGALEAVRVVLGLLQIPVSLPEPDSPALGEAPT